MDENHLDHSLDNERLQDSSIHISDVIEVIATDPDFNAESTMYNGGGEIPHPLPSNSQNRRLAHVQIVEQPASKALRFRYECEGRSAGSIPGASSTPENKTFPSIRVNGYQGRAVVVVSCVTKDEPYRPHPHNLVGREGCKKGVCTLEISPETMCVTFSNLGIQCVKKKDIEAALRVREEIKVDPFMTGFGHRNQPTSIDLNAVRLCFQVFLQDERKGKFTVPLTPVVSDPIYDKKAMCDLLIVKLSHCNCTVDGGSDMILLCEKVAKEDIQVRFFEEKDGHVIWEGFGEFQPSQVHKQTAIWFKPPRYNRPDITEPVKVFIQLKRPSDGATSEALKFEYLPLNSESPFRRKNKRQKINDPQLMRHIEDTDKNTLQFRMNIPTQEIKIEPRGPSPYGGQMYQGLSPAYVPQSVSPHYIATSPDNNIFNQPQSTLPPINTMMQQSWNVPASSNAQNWNCPTKNDLESAAGLSGLSILNMDNNQLETTSEMPPLDLNSGDLNMLEANGLSASFQQNLSLTDFGGGTNDQNMSDSLTRLANSAVDKFYQ